MEISTLWFTQNVTFLACVFFTSFARITEEAPADGVLKLKYSIMMSLEREFCNWMNTFRCVVHLRQMPLYSRWIWRIILMQINLPNSSQSQILNLGHFVLRFISSKNISCSQLINDFIFPKMRLISIQKPARDVHKWTSSWFPVRLAVSMFQCFLFLFPIIIVFLSWWRQNVNLRRLSCSLSPHLVGVSMCGGVCKVMVASVVAAQRLNVSRI